MKFNIVTLVIFGAGVVLMYAGVKNVNPKTVITESLAGRSPSGTAEPKAEGSVRHPAANNDQGTANV